MSPGAALLLGGGAVLALLPVRARGAAGTAALLLLGAALLLAGGDLLAGDCPDGWGALGRALTAAGGLGALLLGSARGSGALPPRAAGLLLAAAAGLDLACTAGGIEALLLGWGAALLGTLGAAVAAGWVQGAALRGLLLQAGLGACAALLGALLLARVGGAASFERAALAAGPPGALPLLGALALALGLLHPPGTLPFPRQEPLLTLPPPLASWIAGPLTIAGAFAAARALLPLAAAGEAAGPWRLALAGLGLLVVLRGARLALGADTLPGLVAGAARAQAGWLLLGLSALAPTPAAQGWVLSTSGAALGWQATALLTAGLAGWAFCALAEDVWGDAGLARLAGLSRRNAWLGAWLLLPLLALAGLPPLLAFPGRLALLAALERALPAWVGGVAALALLPGALVALRVARVAFHRPGGRREPEEPLVADAGLTLLCGVLAPLALLLGLAPPGLERALGALALP